MCDHYRLDIKIIDSTFAIRESEDYFMTNLLNDDKRNLGKRVIIEKLFRQVLKIIGCHSLQKPNKMIFSKLTSSPNKF